MVHHRGLSRALKTPRRGVVASRDVGRPARAVLVPDGARTPAFPGRNAKKNKPHASVGLILVRHFRPKTNQVLLRGRTGGRPQLRFTTMRHFTSFSSACKTSRRVFSWLWYSSRPMTRAFSFGLFFRYCCLSTACLWSINRYRTRCSFQSQCTATSLP